MKYLEVLESAKGKAIASKMGHAEVWMDKDGDFYACWPGYGYKDMKYVACVNDDGSVELRNGFQP